MSSLIGALRVTLGLDSAAFEKGATATERRMNKMERSIEGFGKKLSGVGQTLSIAVTAPMVAFGIASVKAAAESRDAMAQVEASLKSMGDASGRTAAQLGDMASGIMARSLYDDDEVLRKVTANLLTFGKISGSVFDRAQQAAVDLSARLGTDLQSSAIMLGKALNDPVKGVTALTRVGVSFTAQQKAQIKAMAEAGNVAGAQSLILSELSKQYGGSAEAALKAAGPLAALKKRFDALAETVGGVLLVAIERITPIITRIADGFLALSPGMQTAIVAGGALVAVLGPLALALGGIIQFAAPMLAFMGTLGGIMASAGSAGGAAAAGIAGLGSVLGSLLAVLGPLALAIGAGYIAWKNWDDIGPRLTPIIGNLRDIAEAVGLLGPRVDEAGQKTDGYATDLADLARVATETSNTFQRWADAFDAYNARTAAAARENGTTIQAGLRDLWAGFESFVARLNGWGAAVSKVLSDVWTIGRDIVAGIARGIRQAPTAVWDALKSVISSGISNAKTFLGIQSPSRVFMEIGDFIGQGLAIGIEGGKKKVDAATRKLTEAARKAADEVRDLFARLFPEVEAFNKYKADLDRIEGSGRSEDAKSEARRRLGLEFKGMTGPVEVFTEQGPLDVTKGLDDVLDALDTFKKRAGTTAVTVAKSFKDMADETLRSLSNLANSIKGGGILGILEAVIGIGLQLGSIGVFGKTVAGRINAPKVPGYAGGTNFHPGGLAVVGERGPELLDLPRGSKVYPNGAGPSGGGSTVQVIPSPYFDVVVDGRIVRAGPAIMQGGAQVAQAQMAQRQRRRVG
ncbi:phage tail length tape measure family protein [Tsuneonella sp. HG094]